MDSSITIIIAILLIWILLSAAILIPACMLSSRLSRDEEKRETRRPGKDSAGQIPDIT